MMTLKTTKEYESYNGFTLKENMIYGDVNGLHMVITSVPYAYTETTDEIHLWILEDGKWTLQYIDGYLLEDVELDLGGFEVYLLDFIKAMQWTQSPAEIEYIYFKSLLPPVITTYRKMYGLWTIEEIFEMEQEALKMENKKKIKKPTYNVWEITSLQQGINRSVSAIDTRKLCTYELNKELERYSQSKTHLDNKMWVSIINQLLFDECSEELWKKLGHIVDTYNLTYI